MVRLTYDYLIDNVYYSIITGEMIWIKKRGNIRIGDKVGSVSQYGYIKTSINGECFILHRIIWLYVTGEWPIGDVDHSNLDRACNAWINLRDCSRQQNHFNKTKQKNNKSGYKGVSWNKQYKMYSAVIYFNRKQKHLGYFNCPKLAHEAYCEAAKKLHGEYFNET